MIANADIKIEKTTESRVNEYDVNNVPFGKCFSDHMFVAEYANGKWEKSYITPYRDVPMSYAMSALHYGQAIFEGMKAYKSESGELSIFRPLKNFKRFQMEMLKDLKPSKTICRARLFRNSGGCWMYDDRPLHLSDDAKERRLWDAKAKEQEQSKTTQKQQKEY